MQLQLLVNLVVRYQPLLLEPAVERLVVVCEYIWTFTENYNWIKCYHRFPGYVIKCYYTVRQFVDFFLTNINLCTLIVESTVLPECVVAFFHFVFSIYCILPAILNQLHFGLRSYLKHHFNFAWITKLCDLKNSIAYWSICTFSTILLHIKRNNLWQIYYSHLQYFQTLLTE